jgi:hypothetical protein
MAAAEWVHHPSNETRTAHLATENRAYVGEALSRENPHITGNIAIRESPALDGKSRALELCW